MATTVTEIAEGRRSVQNEDGRQHTRVFRVAWDNTLGKESLAYDSLTAEGDDNIPKIGEEHPQDAYARVVSIEPTSVPEGHGRVFDVIVRYNTKTHHVGWKPGSEEPEYIEDPPDRPTKYRFGSETMQVVVERTVDVAKDAITNTAGDIFTQPPVMRDQDIHTLTITRYEAINGFDLNSRIQAYNNTVNAGSFIGWLRGQARINISGESVFEAGRWYWIVTYVLRFFEGYEDDQGQMTGWQAWVLNQGMQTRDAQGKKHNITDDSGSEAMTPKNLSLADPTTNEVTVVTNPANAVHLRFNIYPETDFSAITPPLIQ